MDEVKILVAKINKQYGEATIGFASDKKYADAPRISSGSLFLDWALGKNAKDNSAGFPIGRLVELYGPESSGKSTIAMKTIAEAQKRGMGCLYIDCENSFDKNFAEALGVDTSKLLITSENGLDKVFNLMANILNEDNYQNINIKVIVVDSIAALIPTEEVVKEQGEKKTMASTAKGMAEGLRRLNHANKNKALIIFINQLRQNPGATYGNPEYTPGGNSMKYYSSVRAEIRKGDWIMKEEEGKETKEKIGQVVRFKIIKNKVAPPFKEGYFKFFYAGELDKIDELVSLAILQDKISRKGAYFGFGKHSYQGRESMENALKTQPEVFEELRKLVFEGGE